FEAWRISIGEKLSPVAIALLGWLTGQMPALQAWGNAMVDKLIPAVERLGSALARIAPAAGQLAAEFLSMLPSAVAIAAVLASTMAPALAAVANHMDVIAPILAVLVASWVAMNVAMAVTKGLAIASFLAELAAQFAIA